MGGNIDLRRVLEDKFDPTDADKAMRLAHVSLKLAAWAAKAVWCYEVADFKLGRDNSARLGMAIKNELKALGVLSPYADGTEDDAVWSALLKEVGITS